MRSSEERHMRLVLVQVGVVKVVLGPVPLFAPVLAKPLPPS